MSSKHHLTVLNLILRLSRTLKKHCLVMLMSTIMGHHVAAGICLQ